MLTLGAYEESEFAYVNQEADQQRSVTTCLVTSPTPNHPIYALSDLALSMLTGTRRIRRRDGAKQGVPHERRTFS